MNTSAVQTLLSNAALEPLWHDILDAYIEGAEAEKQRLIAWINDVRNTIVRCALDIGDDNPEELLVSVALRYIELKSQWHMLNTQINYQVFRKGEAEPMLLYQSSLLSTLVDALQQLLSNEDLAKIDEFLTNPVADTV
ncbi:MAG: hypothetical protein RML40_09545 [Bacteroidota bacterium]|nr:hypothetical protein [Candidatus Kapabacteria bacterium]MDW8220761.1 hypothetical protein [Bacteroidota bacterium]